MRRKRPNNSEKTGDRDSFSSGSRTQAVRMLASDELIAERRAEAARDEEEARQ
jgi:hypothetical protein